MPDSFLPFHGITSSNAILEPNFLPPRKREFSELRDVFRWPVCTDVYRQSMRVKQRIYTRRTPKTVQWKAAVKLLGQPQCSLK
jgi:hypothetical protein